MPCSTRRASAYYPTIAESIIAAGFTPTPDLGRWVEGWMRLHHATLDHLSPEEFAADVRLSLACVATDGPDASEALAQSFGL